MTKMTRMLLYRTYTIEAKNHEKALFVCFYIQITPFNDSSLQFYHNYRSSKINLG